MSKLRSFSTGITVSDWMKSRPYDNFQPYYDGYYLRLANTVLDHFLAPKMGMHEQVPRSSLKELAMIVTGHFEDFVNEIGIFAAFRRKNQAFYGCPIPIVNLTDYDADYLNEADFSYLIWHHLCKMLDQTFNPFHVITLNAGAFCYDFFEPLIDDAPTTSFYDDWLTFDGSINYFELKPKLSWMAFGSYLNGFELTDAFEEDSIKIVKDPKMAGLYQDMKQIMYGIHDDYLLKKRASWCAMSATEWLAEVARCPDELRPKIRAVSRRVMGSFLYESHDEIHYHFRFIKTGRLFNVLRTSVDLDLKKMEPGKDGGIFGIVEWNGEWWLSGVFIGDSFTQKEMDKIRIAPSGSNFYGWSAEKQVKIHDLSAGMEQAFIEYFGNRLVLFPNEEVMKTALQEQNSWWNEHKALKAEPSKRTSKYAELLAESNSDFDKLDLDGSRGIAVFFEPGQGQFISATVPELVRLLEKKTLTMEESKQLFYTFFRDCSPALAQELIGRYGSENLCFPPVKDPKFAEQYFLFFQHFYNPSNFGETVPNLALMLAD